MTTVASPQNQPANHKTAVRWSTIRQELLHISWLIMELALITPAALALLPWTRLWPPLPFFLLLAALMLLASLLLRFMNLQQISKPTQQNVIILTLLLTQLLLMRSLIYGPRPLFDLSWLQLFFNNLAEPGNRQWLFDISLFLTVAFVWWRGIRLVGRKPDIYKAGLYLRVGSLLLAPAIIWFGRQLLWNITPFLLLFFAAGLITLALIRAEQVEISTSGQSAAVTPRWLLTVVLAALGVVLTAVSLAAFLSNDTSLAIVRFFTPVWIAATLALKVLSSTLLYLSTPLLFLFEQFLLLLATIIAQILARLLPLFQKGLTQLGLDTILPQLDLPEQEAIVRQTINDKLIIILLMLAVILLVALAVRRAIQQRSVSDAPVRQGANPTTTSPPKSLLSNLRQQLNDLLNWRTAVSIRRTYRQMCQAAASLGFARGQAQTPTEYLVTLQEAWPEHPHETAVITHAYNKIRYGEYPESAAELEEIRISWQRLQQTTTRKNKRQETAVHLKNEHEN